MSVAEEMEVAEITVNQEDEMESWSFGDEAQRAMDDRSGRLIDVELVKEARAEEVIFMESFPVLGGVQHGRVSCKNGKGSHFDPAMEKC